MATKLKKLLSSQPKSKVKAGDGLTEGEYKFFTSSLEQKKYLDYFQYCDKALIFGTGGNANVHYSDTPFSTSTDCLVFYGNGLVDLKMIFYFLSGNMQILQNGFKGAGLKHVSKDYILDIGINIPTSEVQDRIVKTFDLLEKMIIFKNKQLEKLDLLVKSRFYREMETTA